MTWPLAPLTPFSFDLIAADPPWSFNLYSEAGEEKSPQAHYDCMPIEDIMALPVGHLVGANSWLLLWATAPLLPEALAVMSAWGFTYKTRISWRKLTANGKTAMGPGYIARTMHEDVLIGACGSPERRRALPSLFDGVRREHSRKPAEFYPLVDAFAAPHARKLDLFSRETRPGWTSWGREVGKFDAHPASSPSAQSAGDAGARPEKDLDEARPGTGLSIAAANPGHCVTSSAAGEGLALPDDPAAAPDLFSIKGAA